MQKHSFWERNKSRTRREHMPSDRTEFFELLENDQVRSKMSARRQESSSFFRLFLRVGLIAHLPCIRISFFSISSPPPPFLVLYASDSEELFVRIRKRTEELKNERGVLCTNPENYKCSRRRRKKVTVLIALKSSGIRSPDPKHS